MHLPQCDAGRCVCHFAALLEIDNRTADDVRLELLTPQGESWATIVPLVRAHSAWAQERRTPLWIPRVKAVRIVGCADGLERWRKAPWGDGGRIVLE